MEGGIKKVSPVQEEVKQQPRKQWGGNDQPKRYDAMKQHLDNIKVRDHDDLDDSDDSEIGGDRDDDKL